MNRLKFCISHHPHRAACKMKTAYTNMLNLHVFSRIAIHFLANTLYTNCEQANQFDNQYAALSITINSVNTVFVHIHHF